MVIWFSNMMPSNCYSRIPYEVRSKSSKYILEHRLVMIGELGRLLSQDEVIHHKNGCRFDNRPFNLELTDKKGHMIHHPIWNKGMKTKLKTTKEWFAEYRCANRAQINRNNRAYKLRRKVGLLDKQITPYLGVMNNLFGEVL